MSAAANPLQTAHAKLIERLAQLVIPRAIRTFPSPSDFEAVAQYIREAAEIMDDWSEAIGFQVADNSPFSTDPRDFAGVVTDGVSNAAYACTSVADRMRDEREAA
jgi:hypothetical protein